MSGPTCRDPVMSGRTLKLLRRLFGVYANRRDFYARESGFAMAKIKQDNTGYWARLHRESRNLALGFQECIASIQTEIDEASTLATGATHAGDSNPL